MLKQLQQFATFVIEELSKFFSSPPVLFQFSVPSNSAMILIPGKAQETVLEIVSETALETVPETAPEKTDSESDLGKLSLDDLFKRYRDEVESQLEPKPQPEPQPQSELLAKEDKTPNKQGIKRPRSNKREDQTSRPNNQSLNKRIQHNYRKRRNAIIRLNQMNRSCKTQNEMKPQQVVQNLNATVKLHQELIVQEKRNRARKLSDEADELERRFGGLPEAKFDHRSNSKRGHKSF